MALTKIGTDGIKDDAVTTDKVANAINTSIAANTAKDLTALSAANLTSGTIPDARFPATLPAASAANLTAVPAANITGTLPAISATNLTNIPAANITGTLPAISGANLTDLPASGKATNLVINGAMNIAQRSAGPNEANGFGTVDRFSVEYSGQDQDPSQAQVDIGSNKDPYYKGFRKALKVTNGNQTSGAGTHDRVTIGYKIEARDIATSGWNYQSASSYITFSYWVRSSVAQNFYNTFTSDDGSSQRYTTETGSLSANTWTKITKTIPGNSNLTFNNDNGEGLEITWELFRGTEYTGTKPLNAWAASSNGSRTPDQTSTWYTTNDATFEITGVLLEVGDSASDYPHRTFADDLYTCQRYYDKSYSYSTATGTATTTGAVVHTLSGSYNYAGFPIEFSRAMRADPTITLYSTNNGSTGKTSADSGDGNASVSYQSEKRAFVFRANANNGMGTNVFLRCQFQADAEL